MSTVIRDAYPRDLPKIPFLFRVLRVFERRSDRKLRHHLEDMPDYLLQDIGLCRGEDPADRDIMTLNAILRSGVLPTRPL